MRKYLSRFIPWLRRKPLNAHTSINNLIGNAVAYRKHKLYAELRGGADPETSIDAFLSNLKTDLMAILRKRQRSNYRPPAMPESGRIEVVQEGRAILIPSAHTSKRRQ